MSGEHGRRPPVRGRDHWERERWRESQAYWDKMLKLHGPFGCGLRMVLALLALVAIFWLLATFAQGC